MINSGHEWDWMDEQQQIEEILEEANAYGLREEVKKLAKTRIGFWEMSKVNIYQWAYKKYIRDGE